MRMEAPITNVPAPVAVRVYLHAYGGTPVPGTDVAGGVGLSPCVWRHLKKVGAIQTQQGSISMRMEAPLLNSFTFVLDRVYLHAYGGTAHQVQTR